MNPEWDTIPLCSTCRQPMRLNTAVSTENHRQYLCSCHLELKYHNVHRNQKPREDR